jgi:ribonuclease HII
MNFIPIDPEAKMTDARIKKYENEKIRLNALLRYENELYEKGINYIAGMDEVGRGPLAGPVVTCAIILKKDILIEGVNDSKKVSEQKREALFNIILDNSVSYGIGIINEKIIDEINILNATRLAMKEAVEKLDVRPEHVLIDAENLNIEIPHTAIIKGDALSFSIAASSIVAKVTRDRMMAAYDEIYPEYGFKKNKGYGTSEHINAILKYGPSPIHRKSFIKGILGE